MADYDPSELLTLCASILHDGEVTIEEAYRLAEWLNIHPDAADNWPGRELVKPLQEIWADGDVSRREIHRLATLLISVQREWARQPQTRISPYGDEIPVFTATDLNEVRLPSVRGRFQVPSQNDPGRFYNVDLIGPSCTCPDWRTWRSNLPTGDLTRCCKHVLSVYARLARRRDTDGWLMAFIENGWPAHPGARWQVVKVASAQVLFCTPSDKGWANVFAKDGQEYARFGFNVDEQRWAYGSQPAGAATIASAITNVDKTPRPRYAASTGETSRTSTSGSRSIIVWVLVSVGTAILVFAMILAEMIGRMVLTPKNDESRRRVETPVAQLSPVPSLAPRALPTADPWLATTIQEVRVSTYKGKFTIPKGTKLRVIGRTDDDLVARYNDITVTIPRATTDFR